LGHGLLPELTGRENIVIAGQLDGLSATVIEEITETVIEFADIGLYIDEPVKNYSNGMFLRLAFAIRTATVPDVLILDEIIEVGDLTFREKCKNKIDELKQMGTVLVMASHNPNEIINFCDKSLLLKNGNLCYFGNTIDALGIYTKNEPNQLVNNYSYPHDTEQPEILLHNIRLETSAPSKKNVFKFSDSFDLKFELSKTKGSPACNVVVFISNLTSIIHSDSFIYRETATSISPGVGKYQIAVNFPPKLFNQGTYFISIIVGFDSTTFIRTKTCAEFKIAPDEWESKKIWNNNNDYFPFRTPLQWIINTV
jgi:energy-coupling factor transporter ATP-binding protein EcfA2